ncbi:MAG TPA: methyl-accepting chemotaxis protein [Eoetvoesiella sp.]
MSWLAQLTVKTKLIGGFLIVAAIAAIIGGVGINSASRINGMASFMYDREVVGLNYASEANAYLLIAGRTMRNALLAHTKTERSSQLDELRKRFDAVKERVNQLDTLFVTEAGKAAVGQTRKAVLAYEDALKKVVVVLNSEPPGEAIDSLAMLDAEAKPLGDAAEAMMSKLTEEKQANAHSFAAEISAVYASTQILLIALTLGGVVLAILLGVVITAVLARQLGGEPKDVARIAGAIANGDLTNKIDIARVGEGSVIHAMHLMQESLRNVVQSVRASSDNIATGSNQIAVGNADLSQRTEEQAANLTQTAAAMEELSSTVKSNADVAQQAAQLAGSASVAASKGGEVVNNVVVTMDEINDASRKIVDIIAVIDGIAFQTNILALNAAVEAARAGEQGRGFAVVATEVRTLAQRSASAAKDIKNLIDNSVAKVDIGTKLVDEAGEAMQGIVKQVKQVTDLINEISAATNEQTTGLGQINDAVMQLSDVTQQNAALVEESASAADSLNEQAQNLVEVVGVFKVGQERAVVKRLIADQEQAVVQRRAHEPSVSPSRSPARALAGAVRSNNQAAAAARPLTMGASQKIREEEWEEF